MLRNQRNRGTAQATQLALRSPDQFTPLPANAAVGGQAHTRRQQAQNSQPGQRFARAGLAGQAEHLSGCQFEIKTADQGQVLVAGSHRQP